MYKTEARASARAE